MHVCMAFILCTLQTLFMSADLRCLLIFSEEKRQMTQQKQNNHCLGLSFSLAVG